MIRSRGLPRLAVLALVALAALEFTGALGAPPAAAEAPRGGESYSGFTLDRLAEALARFTTLRTQYGEARGKTEFERWLAGEGLTSTGYEAAYAAWWERFRADPTGQLEARFLRINGEQVQLLNYGDAADRRQETREGVTLDTYARIAVELTRLPGADLARVLARHGVRDAAHWQRVNEAWGKAMKEDTTFALVQQYSALYQKYAGPQFVAEQDAVVANSVAGHHAAPPAAAPPRAGAPDLGASYERLARSTGAERARAAREIAIACELWLGPASRDPGDARAPYCAPGRLRAELLPAILEGLERADDDSIGFAVGLVGELDELELAGPEAKSTATRALARARTRLETLAVSFAPIADKAVPERLPLRAKIDEYTHAVAELERILARW
ncbi:MAG: hypothetical protein U0X73_11735 [Thermoanaerobaculia bacterium]